MKKEYKEADKKYIINWIIFIVILIIVMLIIIKVPEQNINIINENIEKHYNASNTSNDIIIKIKNIIFIIIIYTINKMDTILLIINTILLSKILKKIKN